MNLSTFVSQHHQEAWELWAAAAGHPIALASARQGISRAALNDGPYGAALTLGVVEERIEAIAAYDPHLLKTVTQEWIAPQFIRDAAWYEWWREAWSISLRHLKAINAVQYEYVDVPALKDAVQRVWPRSNSDLVSWRQLRDMLTPINDAINYDTVFDHHYTLQEKLLSNDDLATAPDVMLRLLRGRTHLLDDSAREYLFQRALPCMFLDPWFYLVMETVIELLPQTRALFATKFMAYVDSSPALNPRSLARIVYILLGNWHTP